MKLTIRNLRNLVLIKNAGKYSHWLKDCIYSINIVGNIQIEFSGIISCVYLEKIRSYFGIYYIDNNKIIICSL